MQRQPDKAPLDEVMMAMDVVDTLRHQKLLVDRELNSDEREQRLIERLRKLYASQGIEVPDSILAEGVKALDEDRFTYQPRAHGIQTALARIYIDRGRWARRIGLLMLAVLLGWGAWVLLVTLPENRRIESEVSQLNNEISTAAASLLQMKQELQRLQELLKTPVTEASDEAVQMIERTRRRAGKSLEEAAASISSVEALSPSDKLTADNFTQDAPLIRQNLIRYGELTSSAQASLAESARLIRNLSSLDELPAELAAELEAIKKISRVNEATKMAQREYESSIAALRAGDIDSASGGHAKLQSLRQQLASSYTLQIVSRPDERSGVWRGTQTNPGAKNYYLIVEAVDDAGVPLTLPVKNEEDGAIYHVNKWGLRVTRSVYQRVAADKQDDGIIQQRSVGSKQIGYLKPEYSISTTGAMITSW